MAYSPAPVAGARIMRAPVQPLWSFASNPLSSQAINNVEVAPVGLRSPVQSWSRSADGRPQMRWAVRRSDAE